jgi:tRNA(Arg) A34 adenosine deaminase TadA
MRLAVHLASANVDRETGGPFGAAIFDVDSGRLLSVGVNLVTEIGYSFAHAEIVAITMAQNILGTYDLGAGGGGGYELVSSTEPCAMCMGAIPWSGIRRLMCGARGSDAEDIGMDEGAKPTNWIQKFKKRGVQVERDICRDEAVAVLKAYVEDGGIIYNSTRAE